MPNTNPSSSELNAAEGLASLGKPSSSELNAAQGLASLGTKRKNLKGGALLQAQPSKKVRKSRKSRKARKTRRHRK